MRARRAPIPVSIDAIVNGIGMVMRSLSISRRRLLTNLGVMAGIGALSQLAGCALPGPRITRRLTFCGQLLIAHDLCAAAYDGFAAIVRELRRGDVVFSDLETPIRTPASGAPTRDNEFFHVAGLDELRCVREMGFKLLALANNHAWDLGTEGILATRDAVAAQGFAFAGTGENLAAAARPAVLGDVALVAMATGKIRDGAAATPMRPGVNELRLGPDLRLDSADAERNLNAIRTAARAARIVIAYLHNHEWGEDMSVVQPWSRDWAHACIDAGATLFISHGAPLLRAIETYRGRPIFHGLGSLVFHSRTPLGHYPASVWESAIVHYELADGGARVELVPIVLNERGDDPARQNETRGRPRIARGADAQRILERLAMLSAPLGTRIDIRDERGWIEPA
jgi:poly-gamma-glutamate capsule biosynthesis protein CapA/YwtB (metallophosphatase superfamily)